MAGTIGYWLLTQCQEPVCEDFVRMLARLPTKFRDTCFDASTLTIYLGNIYMTPDYSIRELTEEEFTPLFDKCKASVFEDVHSYDLRDILSSAELEHIKELGQGLGHQCKLYLGVFDKDNKFVGWSWGSQESASTFYMVNSGILKDHRRKGLYGTLLGRCIEVLSKKGFQLIYSRHCATNNAVIIPQITSRVYYLKNGTG